MSLSAVPNGENGDNGDDDDMVEDLENWATEMEGLSERIRRVAAQMRRGEKPRG